MDPMIIMVLIMITIMRVMFMTTMIMTIIKMMTIIMSTMTMVMIMMIMKTTIIIIMMIVMMMTMILLMMIIMMVMTMILIMTILKMTTTMMIMIMMGLIMKLEGFILVGFSPNLIRGIPADEILEHGGPQGFSPPALRLYSLFCILSPPFHPKGFCKPSIIFFLKE